MIDNYIYVIVALLPLSAIMLTVQVNPYHALIIRGILGGIAALVYAVLGAADVALTEALVGTMLSITLYAVAVRSSLSMRLGILKDEWELHPLPASELEKSSKQPSLNQLTEAFRSMLVPHHVRLEIIPYGDVYALHQALMDKEIHSTCTHQALPFTLHQTLETTTAERSEALPYHTVTRIRRLYELMVAELDAPTTTLAYFPVNDFHLSALPNAIAPDSQEAHS